MSFVIVADFSESAAAFWPQTARVVADCIAAWPEDSVSGVHLLGTCLRWEPDDWLADRPPPAVTGGSFLAPVMAALAERRDHPAGIVLVGAGPVFDLDDWLTLSGGTHWALVRTGGESLQGARRSVLEVTPDDLKLVISQLRSPAQLPAAQPVNEIISGNQWTVDRAGYPLVKIDPLDAYLHLWPVTKPQFEYFLWDAPAAAHGDAWYAEVLQLNPRLSPTDQALLDYERLFMTGLLPDEVCAYQRWCGAEYSLPTVEQWRTAFGWLAKRDISAPYIQDKPPALTAQRLWQNLRACRQPAVMLDLAFMRGGVIEWTQAAGEWRGMGQPRDTFFPTYHDAIHDEAISPTSQPRRSKAWGFRLLRRA